MSDESTSGGGGCMVPLAAWTAVIASVLYVVFDWAPKDALAGGMKGAAALMCGIPIAIIAGGALIVALMVGWSFVSGWLADRRDRRWRKHMNGQEYP